MKILFISLFLACGISAQSLTTITGPLYDSSGALAACQLTIRPASDPIFSPTIISYTIVSGDLTGSSGGYGSGVTSIFRHAALQLYPGVYSVAFRCQDVLVANKPYTWNVPAVSIWSLANLNQGIGQRLGQITTTLGGTPSTLGAQ